MCILWLQHSIHNGVELTAELPECHIGREVSAVRNIVHRMLRILFVSENLLAVLDELLLRNFHGDSIVLIVDR